MLRQVVESRWRVLVLNLRGSRGRAELARSVLVLRSSSYACFPVGRLSDWWVWRRASHYLKFTPSPQMTQQLFEEKAKYFSGVGRSGFPRFFVGCQAFFLSPFRGTSCKYRLAV